ncbi:hypothetical protein C8A01DRAFT_31766 [Parachaetomium inaequale]|uniref:Amidase domain-containing protein n=1 Tax=Parachaetomium inaequale TaxID=2588326 RepID=A0AAN6SV16_9PEZI|nr:hypothetical protein C8A01DRAFT_31766 [Parachaetomium inaequale]
MKFSYILSALLATVTIAVPLTDPEATTEVATLIPRAVVYEDTPEYKAAIKAHSGLQADHYYWFKYEWPLKTAVGDGDKESQKELQELQKKLGFAHIGVVVGHVTETAKGKGKNAKTHRHFNAMLYHMTKKNVNPGDTEMKSAVWKASSSKKLKWGGSTTKSKAAAAKKVAKDYVAEHKVYAVDGNNCNDFAKAVIKSL